MKKIFSVEGMMCEHCVKAVKGAIEELDGINGVSVDLVSKKVTVEYDENRTDDKKIIEAVDEQGYEAVLA